jgi:hypothetical protein
MVRYTAIPAKSFPAVLQTAIVKYHKPRALPWAVVPPVLRTEQELCCHQPERLTVQQPRATPWGLFRDILQSEGLQEFLAGIAVRDIYLLLSLFLFILISSIPNHAAAMDDVSVNTSLDSTTLYQGWPIKGTIEVTHDVSQNVDEASVTMDGKPLKIQLLRNVKISPDSPITVSIYQFTLPAQNRGSYTLPPISLKINGKMYQTLSYPYDVQGPIAPPPTAPGGTEESSLKLEAYIDGPKDLYPGQKTRLVYRYIYKGNIALGQEVLPMLEAKGLQKIGRYDIKNYTEGNSSIFEISQIVQALKPGDFSWGPSHLEGIVYVEDALGNKQYTTTKLIAQAPVVQLTVKPFPLEGKPASFNGAFGQFNFDVKLSGVDKMSVGDPLMFNVSITGKTSNWDSVMLPDLCCQPGFAGFFKPSDLPPVGQLQGESKVFPVTMNPLSSAIKSVPAIQFSYFEPDSGKYKILYSKPLAISVAPVQEIPQVQENALALQKTFKSQETAAEWLHIYRGLPPIAPEDFLALKPEDLRDHILGSWWTLWLIPLSAIFLVLQYKFKKYLVSQQGRVKTKSSRDLYEEMLKAPPASPQFFQLLNECLILRLYERGDIEKPDMDPEELPKNGLTGDVGEYLRKINFMRYTDAASDAAIYQRILEQSKKLYQSLGNHANAK